MEPLYRPLQPAPSSSSSGSDGSRFPGPSRSRELPRKRGPTVAPCEPCRKHKRKCDGIRPICHSCSSRGRDCEYTTAPDESRIASLKRKYDELEKDTKRLRSSGAALSDLVALIRSRDEADAFTVFQQLRSGADPESILRSVRDGDLLLQLQVAPETRFRYAFPFRKEIPSFLRAFAQPYFSSMLFEATAEATGQGLQTAPIRSHDWNEEHRPQFFKPYHAAKIIDPRLDTIKPSEWTSVCDDDELMRLLLRLYYQHEYPWFTCFHMDAFLDDMISGNNRYCSSLLVNAILAEACHCHLGFDSRMEHWNPQGLGYRFLAEAKRQFEEELNTTHSITLLQASMIINMTLNMHSVDKLGRIYALHSVAIAYSLGLYEKPSKPRSERRQRVYDYTAWNLYFWVSLQCYHFLLPPMIKTTPVTPLPDPSKDPAWYGETWVHYPASQKPVSLHHGYVCKAKAELAQIINALGARLWGTAKESDAAPIPPSVDTILEYSSRLQDWFHSLPSCLTAAEIVFPFQLKIHLCYHDLLVNLCKLSIPNPDEQPSAAQQAQLDSTIAHSRACFEAIIRLYYLRHGYEYSDTYMTHDLSVLAHIAFDQLLEPTGTTKSATTASNTSASTSSAPAAMPVSAAITPPTSTTSATPSTPSASPPLPPAKATASEARSTLILAAKGLNDQARNYYMPFVLFHILLGKMSASDRDILCTLASVRKESTAMSKERARHVQAQYPVGLINLVNHPEKELMGNLIKQYTGLEIGDDHDEGRGASNVSSPAPVAADPRGEEDGGGDGDREDEGSER